MADNITWHHGKVTREDRVKLFGKKNKVFWFTGLSGSGKSTIAVEFEKRLHEQGHPTFILDGDNVRHGLNKNLGFSPEDREENIRRVAEVVKLFYDAGVTVLVCFISPYRNDREYARSLIGDDFVEVYVKCSLETCEERDPKGLYKKVRKGEIRGFTGVDAPYEEPTCPEVTIVSDIVGVDESVSACMDLL
ncbi:adenylyl-sulfate kinase [Candidatus Woesearchaeota archaeon]|nr:adenylyl-sulfate kinase [Candidatus Woesearchaeota archaeon]